MARMVTATLDAADEETGAIAINGAGTVQINGDLVGTLVLMVNSVGAWKEVGQSWACDGTTAARYLLEDPSGDEWKVVCTARTSGSAVVTIKGSA